MGVFGTVPRAGRGLFHLSIASGGQRNARKSRDTAFTHFHSETTESKLGILGGNNNAENCDVTEKIERMS